MKTVGTLFEHSKGGNQSLLWREQNERRATCRAAERIYGPRVITKHVFLATRILNGTLKAHPTRRVRGHAIPGKILKSRLLESLW